MNQIDRLLSKAAKSKKKPHWCVDHQQWETEKHDTVEPFKNWVEKAPSNEDIPPREPGAKYGEHDHVVPFGMRRQPGKRTLAQRLTGRNRNPEDTWEPELIESWANREGWRGGTTGPMPDEGRNEYVRSRRMAGDFKTQNPNVGRWGGTEANISPEESTLLPDVTGTNVRGNKFAPPKFHQNSLHKSLLKLANQGSQNIGSIPIRKSMTGAFQKAPYTFDDKVPTLDEQRAQVESGHAQRYSRASVSGKMSIEDPNEMGLDKDHAQMRHELDVPEYGKIRHSSAIKGPNGRAMVVTTLPDGTRQPFYQRTGTGGTEGSSSKGDWVPIDGIDTSGFDTFMFPGWMDKRNMIHHDLDMDHPLQRYGNDDFMKIGHALDNLRDTHGTPSLMDFLDKGHGNTSHEGHYSQSPWSMLEINHWLGTDTSLGHNDKAYDLKNGSEGSFGQERVAEVFSGHENGLADRQSQQPPQGGIQNSLLKLMKEGERYNPDINERKIPPQHTTTVEEEPALSEESVHTNLRTNPEKFPYMRDRLKTTDPDRRARILDRGLGTRMARPHPTKEGEHMKWPATLEESLLKLMKQGK